ncbi:hypothetical protein CcCBS67573_g03599 [Chytriomyces confervae]|uniref:U3 small nucleolar RNA-associated protein 18 homolog n=1 Tax=Chytriomyces confervae TaxID=246404 RepID=A0A507FHL5_9FUNG|nr:hypothetical protein CcCBS67573_g03599 [Chytriomyces confervae]
MGKKERTTSINIAAPNPLALGKTKKSGGKKGRGTASEAALAKAALLTKEVAALRETVRGIADSRRDQDEEDLEALVFGSTHARVLGGASLSDRNIAKNIPAALEDEEAIDNADNEDLFVIDRRAPKMINNSDQSNDDNDNDDSDDENDQLEGMGNSLTQEQSGKDTETDELWTDTYGNDTAEFNVDISAGANRLRKLRETESETTLSPHEFEARLRKQFMKLYPTPEWALHPDPSLMEEDWDHSSVSTVLRSAKSMIDRSMRNRLPQGSLEMFRVKDANQASPSAAVIQSCKFHPSAPVLLTGGYDRTLRLFHVDGKANPKLQSVYFKDMPIHSADFTADGRQVVVCGRRKFFYVYDVEGAAVERINGIRGRDEKSFEHHVSSPCGKFLAFTGRDGYIILVSRISKQWIANLRMNGTVRALDFSKDGRWLYSIGGDGEVYQWDLATRQCVHKFYDEGAINVNTIAVSPDNSFIATGSSAGIVNVYSSSSALTSERPVPSRTLMNLTTPISTLAFHPSSQALLFASRTKKDSMKIAHCPSLTVFQNWPTANTPLGYVNCVDWSPGGGYLATGNDKGKVLLYRATSFDAC